MFINPVNSSVLQNNTCCAGFSITKSYKFDSHKNMQSQQTKLSNSYSHLNMASKLNFKSAKYTSPVSTAVKYVADLRKAGKFRTIYDVAPEKIEHIIDGIDLFKNMNVRDLYLLPGIVDILTQRGCTNACLHCFIQAHHTLQSIRWEDFTRFTEGLKELKTRLGYHLFDIEREVYDAKRKPYTFSQRVYPYLDADPIEIISTDASGKKYNIKDFVQKFYDDTGVTLKVKTAGWDVDNKTSQQAADDLVELLCQDKYANALPQVIISIHPFQKIMTKANNAKRHNNIEQYNYYRQIYIERMSNVLKTFLPLVPRNKLLINMQYAMGGLYNSGYTKEESKKLCYDILSHLENDCKKHGIDSSCLTAEKDVEKNHVFEEPNAIYSVARNKQAFFNDGSPYTFSFEKTSDNKRRIVIEPFDLKHAYGNEVVENISNNLKQQPDFIDELVLNIDPVNNFYLMISEKNSLVRDIANRFMESIIHTITRLKDVDKDRVVIRLNYSSDSKYNLEKLTELWNKVLNQTGVNFNKIEYVETSKEKYLDKLKKNKYAMQSILENLNPEGRIRFISQLRKGINIDGQVYVPDINTRAFGEEPFEKRAIIIDGLKLNFLYTQPYIHDRSLYQNHRVSYDRQQVNKLCTTK